MKFLAKNNYFRLVFIFVILLGVLLVFYLIYNDQNLSNKYDLQLTNNFKIEPLNVKYGKGLYVNSNDNKVIAVNLLFKGGAGLDSFSKLGSMKILKDMLLRGAGNMNAQQLEEYLKKYSIRISVSLDRDNLVISLITLNYYRNNAFDLLNMILNSPKFTQEELNFVKENAISDIKISEQYTKDIGINKLFQVAFNNKYFMPMSGTIASINSISTKDLYSLKDIALNKNNLYIGVSGNISKKEVEAKLNGILENMPNVKPFDSTYTDFNLNKDKEYIVNKKGATNADIYVAFKMPKAVSQDYFAALVLDNFMGGSGLGSLLMNEVREKKGYVYGINSSLVSSIYGDIWVIHAATLNAKADDTVKAIRDVLNMLKKHDFAKSDIENSKLWLIGNYLDNFSSNEERASTISYMLFKGYNLEGINNRNEVISKISTEDINNVISNNFNHLLVVVVRNTEEK